MSLRTMMRRIVPTRMAERARLLTAVDFDEACRRVSAPTLVVTGEPGLDRVVPVTGTRSYANRISGARHQTLERTGHIGLVTRPGPFGDIVGRFVAERTLDAETIRRPA